MGKGKYKGRRAEAFIFDLDGTLVDSGLDIALSANFTRVHFSLPELPVETAISYVGDGVLKLLERALGHDENTGLTGQSGRPVNQDLLDEGMKVFADHYSRHLMDNTRLYPGVLQTLMRFQRYPLHLATNKPRKFTDQILAGVNLAGAFRTIVAGDETPARKPDARHLALCLEGLDIPTEAVAVVGDSPNDVLAAKALGAVSVGCTFGLVEPGILKSSQPDLIIEEFGQLAQLFPSRGD